MTHKPAVGIGGFGRDNTSELIDHSPYIASAAPSSSPTSKAPPDADNPVVAHHCGAQPMGGRLFHFARLSGADRTTKLKRAATDAFLKIDDIKANEPLRVTSCAGS